MPVMDDLPGSAADRAAAIEDLKRQMSTGRITAQEFADRSRALEQAAAPPVSYGRAPVSAVPADEPIGNLAARGLGGLGRLGGRTVVRLVVWGLGLLLVGGIGWSTSLLGALSDVDLPDVLGSGSTGPSGPASDDTSPATPVRDVPRLHTTGGLERLRAALADDQGRTRYLTAVVYPAYASVEVPVRGRPDRSQRLFYDGAFGRPGTPTPRRPGSRSADLADVDVTALVRAVRRAPARLGVSDPTMTYVVLDERDGVAAMSVYVGDAGGTGYWSRRLDGRTLRTYRP